VASIVLCFPSGIVPCDGEGDRLPDASVEKDRISFSVCSLGSLVLIVTARCIGGEGLDLIFGLQFRVLGAYCDDLDAIYFSFRVVFVTYTSQFVIMQHLGPTGPFPC
jgi:hypothetical protein